MQISKIARKTVILLIAFFLYAMAIVLTIHSQLGASPWEVFHLGISNQTTLTIGRVSQITGLVIIFLGMFLGEFPGMGSILNMYFIGFFTDIIRQYELIPYAQLWWQQYLMLFAGIYLMGWATYFYIGTGLGAGPRDSLMVGIIKKFNCSLWIARGAIEGTVLFIGYLLGGLIGLGTVIMTVTIGLSIEHVYKTMNQEAAAVQHRTLLDIYHKLYPEKLDASKDKVSEIAGCK